MSSCYQILILAGLAVGWSTAAAVAGVVGIPSKFDDEMLRRSSSTETTDRCLSRSCPASTSRYTSGYIPGKTYHYEYKSDIVTSIPGGRGGGGGGGGGGDESSMHMTANVQIEVLSKCQMVLKLTDVSLSDSSGSGLRKERVENEGRFRQKLEEWLLPFGFIEGQIDSVCPHPNEDVWVTNVKRGVLSVLQNTVVEDNVVVTTRRETDVSGNCPTRFETSTSERNVLTIKKTKDLTKCINANSVRTSLQGVDYNLPSGTQSSLSLVKRTQECEQVVDVRTGVLTRSTCEEAHVLRPFASEGSGAETRFNFGLTFKKQMDGIQTRTIDFQFRHKSILFDHDLSDDDQTQTTNEAEKMLNKICEQTTNVEELPDLFSLLVRQLQLLNPENLNRLEAKTRSKLCTNAQKFFRDAIPLVGSVGSVSIIRNLISKGQVKDVEADLWLSSLAFIKNPTPEMINELQPLLESDFERSVLPISSLVNTYVDLYDLGPHDLDKDPAVTSMMKMLEAELNYNCRARSNVNVNDNARMIKAMKAIGNVGRFVATLNRCVGNRDAPVAVRVTAIEAFRRIDCSVDRRDLFKLLEDRSANAELRIHAYLAVVRCADRSVFGRVRALLESEEVNQVGSFIWTHLTNLQETSSPLKNDARAIIENERLRKTFDVDKRKFSRNVELSAFSERLNVGAAIESNVIWSTESFVPRSSMVNLTLDLFGRSVNLLEVGGRAEGMERLLETYFNPGGGGSSKKGGSRDDGGSDPLRHLDRKKDNKVPDDPILSYYLRIFGNEIQSGDLKNFDLDGLQDRFNYIRWLTELARDHRFEVAKTVKFLDASLVVASGVGLPLRLIVDGTATVNVRADAKIDVRNVWSTPSVFDVAGKIVASGAVRVEGEMVVDAHYAKSGLKLKNLLYSTSNVDVKVQLKDGKIFNFDVDLPTDKMELFSAESSLYVTRRGIYQKLESQSRAMLQRNYCTGSQLAKATGLELCGEISLPKLKAGTLFFPLTGPTMAKVYLKKTDSFTGYHFGTSYTRQSQVDTALISFNTPGSRVDRELSVDFRLDRAKQEVTVSVKSPWKKVKLYGQYVNEDNKKQVVLRCVVDRDEKVYSIDASVEIDGVVGGATEVRYVPRITVETPRSRDVILDGSVVHSSGRKTQIGITLRKVFDDPVTLNGSLEYQGRRKTAKYDVNLQLDSPIVRGSVIGMVSNAQDNGQTWSSRADVSYQFKNERKERLTVSNRWRDMSTNNLRSYDIDSAWTSTALPRYNGDLELELSYGSTSIRSKVQMTIDGRKKFTVIENAVVDVGGTDKKVNGIVKFDFPYMNWDFEVKFDHLHNSTVLESAVSVVNKKSTLASVDVAVRKRNSKFMNYVVELKASVLGDEVAVTNVLSEKIRDEYSNDLHVRLPWSSGDMRVGSTYKATSPRNEITAEINLPQWKPIVVTAGLNPRLAELEFHAEANYDEKTYATSVAWKLTRPKTDDFRLEFGVTAAYPGNKHLLSGEISGGTDWEFRGSLIVGLSEKMQVLIGGRLVARPNDPEFQVKVEWPNRFVSIKALGKYRYGGGSSYPSDINLEGSAELESSFGGFEHVSASFRYVWNGVALKTAGDVSWEANRKISASLEYERPKMKVEVVTPFVGYRRMRGESSYSLASKHLEFDSKLDWDGGRTMTMRIRGDVDYPSFTVTVAATTPFAGYESLSADVRHEATGRGNFKTNADVKWSDQKRATMTMTMSHRRNGWEVENSGEMILTTPFRGYRSTRLTWNHENTGSAWKCHHKMDADGQTYSLDVDGVYSVARSTQKVGVKAVFKSPIQGYEEVGLDLNLENETKRLKNAVRLGATWGRKTISYEHDLDIELYDHLKIVCKIKTPFRGYETLGLAMDNRRSQRGNDSSLTLSNELDLGRTGKFRLASAVKISGRYDDVEIDFDLSTPFRDVNRVTAHLRSAGRKRDGNDGWGWSLHGDLEYAPQKLYVVDASVDTRDERKQIELKLTSPHESLRSAKLDLHLIGNRRDFELSSELHHNLLGNDDGGGVAFTVKADTSNIDKMAFLASIRSPFFQLSKFTATLNHARESSERWTATGSYELNWYRGSFRHSTVGGSWRQFNTNSEVEYAKNRKLELATEFSVVSGRSVRSTAAFKSPFDGARKIDVSFHVDGVSIAEFKTAAEVIYDGNRRLGFDAEVAASRERLHVSSTAVTPFSGFEEAGLRLDWMGSMRKFKTDAKASWNRKELVANVDFELTGDGNVKAEGRFETPFRQLRRGTVSFAHDGRNPESVVDRLALKYDENEIVARTEFRLEGPTTMKLSIRTPFDQVRSFGLDLVHSNKRTGGVGGGSFAGWENRLSAEWNGQKYSGESEWSLKGGDVEAKLTLMIPDEYSLRLRHAGRALTDFDSTITVRWAEKSATGTVTFKLSEKNLDAAFVVETPFRNLRRFDVRVSFQGQGDGMKATIAVKTPFRRFESFSAEVLFRGKPSEFTAGAKLEMPSFFASASRVAGTFSHRWRSGDLLDEFTATFDGETISGRASYVANPTTAEGKMELKTPFRSYENFAVSFTCDHSRPENVRFNFDVRTPISGYERFSVELSRSGTSEDFQVRGNVVTSLPTMPSLTLNLVIRAPSNSDDALVSLEIVESKNRFHAKLEHDRRPGTTKTVVAVTTPFRGYESFNLVAGTSGKFWTSISLNGELTTSVRNWQRTVLAWSHDFDDRNGSFNANARLETSIPGWEKMSVASRFHGNENGFEATVSVDAPNAGDKDLEVKISATRNSEKIQLVLIVETSAIKGGRFAFVAEYLTGRDATGAAMSMETPFEDYKMFSISAGNTYAPIVDVGTSARLTSSSMHIVTPMKRLPTLGISMTNLSSRERGLHVLGVVDYSGKEVAFVLIANATVDSLHSSNFSINFRVTSPCPVVRDLSFAISNHLTTNELSGAMEIEINEKKLIDYKYDFTSSKLEATVGFPSRWSMGRFDESRIRVEFEAKRTATTSALSLKTILPRRTIGVAATLDSEPGRFSHSAELLWGSGRDDRLSYRVDYAASDRRPSKTRKIGVKWESSFYGSFETSLNCVHDVSEGKYSTEWTIVTENGRTTTTIKNELVLLNRAFTNLLAVTNPALSRPITLQLDVGRESFRIELNYERQTMKTEGKMTDEASQPSGGGLKKRSVYFRFTHPQSSTDVQLEGDVVRNADKTDVNVATKYTTTKDRKLKTVSMKMTIDKTQKEIVVELLTPLDDVPLKFSAKNNFKGRSDEGIYNFYVSAESKKMNVRANVDVNLKERSFNATVYYDKGNSVELIGRAATPTDVLFEAKRIENGREIQMALASLTYSNDRTLSGNLRLPLDAWHDLVVPLLRGGGGDVPLWRDFLEAVDRARSSALDEWNLKADALREALLPPTKLVRYVGRNFDDLAKKVKAAMNEMMRNNDFYVNDLTKAAQKCYDTFSRDTTSWLSRIRASVRSTMGRCYGLSEEFWSYISNRLISMWRDSRLRPYFEPIVTSMSEKWNDFINWFGNSATIGSAGRMVDRIMHMQMKSSELMMSSSGMMKRLAVWADERILESLSWSQLRESFESIVSFAVENRWVFDYVGLEEEVEYWIEAIRSFTWEKLKEHGVDFIWNVLEWSRNRWTEWNPSSGKYSFEVYVPIHLPDIGSLRELNVARRLGSVWKWFLGFVPNDDMKILEKIYQYKPPSDVADWIPPFKNHATLIGIQHYMTFDKKFYEFAGDCSYVLTRDVVDQTFTVIVNYDRSRSNRPVKRSFTVMTASKQIEIFRDARVTVNGVRTEMPFQVGNTTTVMRNGNRIAVSDNRGVDVDYDLPHDELTVFVTGWLFNKLGGLFGTFNNEPYDDFAAVNGSIVDVPESFARTWAVGQGCQPVNRAVRVARPEPDSPGYKLCRSYFEESSSDFDACFGSVDPAPYMQMCVDSVKDENEDARWREFCNVAASYVRECRRVEVHVRVPNRCVKCDVADTTRSFYQSQPITLASSDVAAHKMADVVFVVQHAKCTTLLLDKIRAVTDELERALVADGIRSNRYAVVGFGGRGFLGPPHVHTTDGQIFGRAGRVSQAFNRFSVDPDDDGGKIDAMSAVRYAAQALPFRAGASKVVVLAACDACCAADSAVRYVDLQRLLVDGDVRLSVLTPESVQMKTTSSKSAYLFGFDETTVYTRKDASSRDPNGQSDLRKYIQLPKDLCLPLSMDSGGAIFSSKHLQDGRVNTIREFTDVMVRVVARKSSPAECQTCECVADETKSGVSRCRRCTPRKPIDWNLSEFEEDETSDATDADKIESQNQNVITIDDPHLGFEIDKLPTTSLPPRIGRGQARKTFRSTRMPSRVHP